MPEEDTIPRVACLFIRETDAGAKEVLFVRSPDGAAFFIPGGRRVEAKLDEDQEEVDKKVLARKMRLDLDVELVLDELTKYTSFAAPAFGKEEGVMVENKYFVAHSYLGLLKTTMQIYALAWRRYDSSMDDCTEADRAAMSLLREEGII